MKSKNQLLHVMKAKKGVLIAAHRGTCGGNIIQNTILAYETALQHGADMIEVDAVKSTDGDFFAFHNGQEKLVLGTSQDIRKMATEEIEQLCCYNQIGEVTNQRPERLEHILEHFKNRCLINIDRSWFYWRETIEFLQKQGMADQILLKSAPNDNLLKTLKECGPDIMYMPIINNEEDFQRASEYDLNIVAAELIFDSTESPLVRPEYMRMLHEKDILTWVNAITLNDTIRLSAGLDDNHAIAEGYEENWGRLIEMGFDIIQTDWPALLNQYMVNRR